MVEDCLDGNAETGFTVTALVAKRIWQGPCVVRSAIWANWLIAPPDTLKMFYAVSICRKGFVDGYNVHNDLHKSCQPCYGTI